MQISSHDKVYEKLLLILVGLFLSSIELFIPRLPIIPWLKPGLTNIITIIWLIRFGYRETILYGIMRLFLTSFFFGFSFMPALLAISGMVTAVSAMKLLLMLNRFSFFGFLGIGITGALFHNLGQLGALKLLLGEASLASLQLPIMIGASLITGSITGLLAANLNGSPLGTGIILTDEISIPTLPFSRKLLSITLLFSMFTVLFFTTLNQHLIFVGIVLSLSLFISPKDILQTIRRFWLLLLIVPLSMYWINRSVTDSVFHFLRLWGWLQCTTIFRFLQSDRLLFLVMHRLFPNRETTLAAALISLEIFPEMIKNGLFRTVGHPKSLIQEPMKFIASILEKSHTILQESGWGKRNNQ